MKRAAPPRVEDVELYWTEQPPAMSPRCTWWVSRIKGGWIGNKRTRVMGYYESAAYFGVYIWEWANVLSPLLNERRTS